MLLHNKVYILGLITSFVGGICGALACSQRQKEVGDNILNDEEQNVIDEILNEEDEEQ